MIDSGVIRQWVTILSPRLRKLKHVKAVRSGTGCLIIEITASPHQKQKTIDEVGEVFEQQGADNIPFKVRTVERVTKLADVTKLVML